MNKRDCYVIDGCVDFIPVKRSALTQNGVEVTIVGSSTKEKVLVDKVYQMSKIFEPQKPVIPQFVAEWIVEAEKIHNNLSWVWFAKPVSDELNAWLENNTETFMRAWLDGYEIEQEKLYTVEIPNPNSAGGKNVLFKQQSTGRLILDMLNPIINKPKYLHLTESEIKKDFEWAWDAGFAKEVE